MNMRNFLIGFSITAGAFAASAAEPQSDTRLAGITFNVSDLDKATDYYKMIGLSVQDRRGNAPTRTQYMVLNVTKGDYSQPGLVLREEKSEPIDAKTNAYRHVIFIVKDAKAICQTLAAAKMPCDREPMSQGPSNTIAAFARDPDGHVVEFLQLTK